MSLCIFGLCSHAIDELIKYFLCLNTTAGNMAPSSDLSGTNLTPNTRYSYYSVSLLFQVDTLLELRRVFMLIQCGRSYIFNDPMNN